MKAEFHPEAAREVEEAQAWYESRSMFAASAFLREFSLAMQRIQTAPHQHARAERGTQRVLLDRFPFTIYYRVRAEELKIVAIAHQKRRPGYWASR